jgi:hypothetical protein
MLFYLYKRSILTWSISLAFISEAVYRLITVLAPVKTIYLTSSSFEGYVPTKIFVFTISDIKNSFINAPAVIFN